MQDYPTAIELFNRFRPKFEQVRLVPHSWGRESYKSTGRFILIICRGDTEVPWHDRYSLPALDTQKAGLTVCFVFDPAAEGNIHDQLQRTVAKEIEGLLKDREFRLVPHIPFDSLTNQAGLISRKQKVELTGDPIPGLCISVAKHESGQLGYWDSFVPKETPEGQAIQAAIVYQHKQTLQARDVAREQSEAKIRLETALSTLV